MDIVDYGDSQEHTPNYADLGIQQTNNIQTTIFGMRRSAQSLTQLEWIFLIASFTSALVSFGFNTYGLATIPQENEEFVFLIVVLLNIVFAVLYALDGVFREQYFEIWAVLCTTLLLVGYIVLNLTSDSDTIKLIRLCVAAILATPVFVSGLMLSRHYFQEGFLVFRTVGARQDLQRACRLLYQAETLLAFDAQGMASLVTFFLKGVAIKPNSEELSTVITGGLLTGFWLLLGYLAMRYESRQATILFLFLGFGQPAFIIWCLYETVDAQIGISPISVLYKSVFLAGATTLIVYILLFLTTILVYKNYSKGLRQKVYEEIPGRNTGVSQ